MFQSPTRSCLELVEAVGGAALAEQLAKAIRREQSTQVCLLIRQQRRSK